MKLTTVTVCLLMLTAGCVGNPSISPGADATERTVTASETPPQQPTTPSSQQYEVDVERIEDLVHEEMNQRREANGREPLARNETLDAVARYKSWDMAQRDYFAHVGPNGTTHAELRDLYSLNCAYTGQNLYKDMSSKHDPNPNLVLIKNDKIATDAVNSLLNSSGHRENALSPHYDSQGIGVFVDENGTVFLTQELCG